MRVADYPTIQDYFGEAIMETNAASSFVFSIAKLMDGITNNVIGQFIKISPQCHVLLTYNWYWQIKFIATKNVAQVCDKMLQACGGTGFKKKLEIERYLRDGKAGGSWNQRTKCCGKLLVN